MARHEGWVSRGPAKDLSGEDTEMWRELGGKKVTRSAMFEGHDIKLTKRDLVRTNAVVATVTNGETGHISVSMSRYCRLVITGEEWTLIPTKRLPEFTPRMVCYTAKSTLGVWTAIVPSPEK